MTVEDGESGKLKLRQKPESQNGEEMNLARWNLKNKFGKYYWLSVSVSENHKKKVGPLRIIRLPSDRSIPASRKLEFNKSIKGFDEVFNPKVEKYVFKSCAQSPA